MYFRTNFFLKYIFYHYFNGSYVDPLQNNYYFLFRFIQFLQIFFLWNELHFHDIISKFCRNYKLIKPYPIKQVMSFLVNLNLVEDSSHSLNPEAIVEVDIGFWCTIPFMVLFNTIILEKNPDRLSELWSLSSLPKLSKLDWRSIRAASYFYPIDGFMLGKICKLINWNQHTIIYCIQNVFYGFKRCALPSILGKYGNIWYFAPHV